MSVSSNRFSSMREESRSNPAGAGWRNGESPSTTAAAFNRMKRARRAPGSVVAPSPSGRFSVLNSSERGPPWPAAGAGAPSQTRSGRATPSSMASHARGVRRVGEDGQGLWCGSINLFVGVVTRAPTGRGQMRGALDRLNRRRLDAKKCAGRRRGFPRRAKRAGREARSSVRVSRRTALERGRTAGAGVC